MDERTLLLQAKMGLQAKNDTTYPNRERAIKLGQEAAEKLLASCDNFVKKYANKYKKCVNFEDGFQLGMLGLLRAIRDYDLDQDVKFLTYGGWKVSSAIQVAFRKKKRNRLVSHSLKNIAVAPVDHKPEINLSVLESRRRYVIEQHYLLGRTMAEIAEELGIHKERVRQLKEEAVEKLRRTVE